MHLGYLAGLLLCSLGANAIQKVSRAGRYLYTADGNRFYIKGVAYQGQGEYAAHKQKCAVPLTLSFWSQVTLSLVQITHSFRRLHSRIPLLMTPHVPATYRSFSS